MATKAVVKLAEASVMDGGIGLTGGFYMPDKYNQSIGLSPDKLIIPTAYHPLIRMCWDFYRRGGMASVVIDRIAELSITDLRNGQRKTSNEANYYFEAILHRAPSHLYRFIRMMALEYFISGMVLPKVEWKTVKGSELHPKLKPNKEYVVPIFDLYPPMLVNVEWVGWGRKTYYLMIPPEDLKVLKSPRRNSQQQMRFEMLNQFSLIMDAFVSGSNKVELKDIDPILRKENSLDPYPIPYLSKVLEALVFKQQLRRMDYAVASRIINAILLVQEGDKDFPLVEGERSNLDKLREQILARANNPMMMERLFTLFSNHTTKLTWITPDVEALLNQEKYKQSNEEVMEGLGFPVILVKGESKGAQAAEVSTWAIQPQMEELRTMILEWLNPVYEMGSDLNNFRNTPSPSFTPIQLQDFIKTAAVFAQAYREGNVSRTTRDHSIGLDFETEVELMLDEVELMKELPKDFPDMPYNIQVVPENAPGTGGNLQKNKTGGKKVGTKNSPVTKKSSGVKIQGQPVARTSPSDKPAKTSKSELEEVELWTDEEVFEALNAEAERRGLSISVEDI
jgi:hypothetical protein